MLAQGPVDEAQKAWIRKRLDFIRNVLGIQQATEPIVYSPRCVELQTT